MAKKKKVVKQPKTGRKGKATGYDLIHMTSRNTSTKSVRLNVSPHMRSITTRVTVDSAGRILLPAKIRKSLSLESGQELSLKVDENRLVLDKVESAIQRLQATAKKKRKGTTGAVDEFLADRRLEAERET